MRRMADRQGYRLTKSRRRDPRALDYGTWYIVDSDSSLLASSEYGMSLDQVEAWLTEDET